MLLLLIALVGLQATTAVAAEPEGFVDRVFRDADGAHKYAVFLPAGYTPEKKWAVILFLHGAGERGSDGRKQLQVGLGPIVRNRVKSFPFVVVFPQCEDVKGRLLTGWKADSPDGRRALAILADVEKNFSIDSKRRILTGWSMGGYGAWSLAAATPRKWAGVVPLAGGGSAADAAKLEDVPVWAFHGADDAAVRPEESRRMIAAIRQVGGRPRYSEVADAGHDVWKVAYADDGLLAWMQNPTAATSESGNVKLSVKPGRKPIEAAADDEPFVPAVEISRAVHVRLGNDMLEALSYSIPAKVPRDLLRGTVGDIVDSTRAEGKTFRVQFSGISYTGRVGRAEVQTTAEKRLRIQLGLSDVNMTIARTYVTGRKRSATAGTIRVVIGHRYPAWLNLEVVPFVEDGRIRLKSASSSFVIPRDNWYVTSPAGVSTRGLGMTREKVSRGLVSGLYGSKSRIEREVLAAVPTVIKGLEENLALDEASDLVAGIWPLPVYRPRVKLHPEAVAVDEDGVSVVLGLTAAAVDPKNAPSEPRRFQATNPSAPVPVNGTGLEIALAPEILGPLTQLLIDADVARIHVEDIPGKTFARFTDRDALRAAIPDLARYGKDLEVWAELVLATPLTIRDAPAAKSMPKAEEQPNGQQPNGETSKEKPTAATVDGSRFRFATPRVLITLAIRSDATKQTWFPYAEFDFNVSQPARVSLTKPSFTRRRVQIEWTGTAAIETSARFAPNYRPEDSRIDTDRIRDLFATAWRAWTAGDPVSKLDVADVDFGASRLRLSSVAWDAPHLVVGFANAGVRLTNSSDVEFPYETKGPYSDWGGPYLLEPGESHEIDVAYPLTYRRRVGSSYETYTLPPGSHSEFRRPDDGGPPALYQAREPEETKESADGGESNEDSSAIRQRNGGTATQTAASR